MYWQPPGEKNIHSEVWSWISEEKELKCDLLACHLSPSRSLVFLQNGWAQFVKDGWLASKGLCVKLFLHYYMVSFCQSCFYNVVLRILVLCVCVRKTFFVLHLIFALLDPLGYYIVYWEWCFMLNVIFLTRHLWIAVTSTSFLVSSAFTPVRKCVCACIYVRVRQRCCSCRYTAGYWFSVPKACLKGKWHDLVFHSSPLLCYYSDHPDCCSICCWLCNSESIIVNNLLFQLLLQSANVQVVTLQRISRSTVWHLVKNVEIWKISKHVFSQLLLKTQSLAHIINHSLA